MKDDDATMTGARPCIVVPIYRLPLSQLEHLSLRRCCEILGRHDIIAITPRRMDLSELLREYPLLHLMRLPDHRFESVQSYNKMMLTYRFYWQFREYTHMLIYQLDAYVFGDELLKWCMSEYDYVGAPWFVNYDRANKTAEYFGVGNGGFSLRRVKSLMRVLRTFRWLDRPFIWSGRKPGAFPVIKRSISGLHRSIMSNNTFSPFNDYPFHEDRFWGIEVPRLFSWYRVPSPVEALRFAFEVMPERMFADSGGVIPFGCHAFARYNPLFWQTYIPINRQNEEL